MRFEVLDDFGHVTVLEEVGRDGGDPHRVFYAAPADDRLVDRKAPTDLASVPAIMWGIVASYGDHTMPALLHDTLCTKAERATPGSGVVVCAARPTSCSARCSRWTPASASAHAG